MPRSMQEIIDQADALAKQIEDYEPTADNARSVGSLMLIRNAVQERAEAERHLAEAVTYARKDGLSWATIGAALGTSGEAARQKYGVVALA